MTQNRWKPSDIIEVKTGWQSNILRIGLFNKNAASSDDNLDLGPEPLAGLRHDVPGEGHHHPPDLWDQVLGFVVRLCFDPSFKDAPRKIVQRVAVRGARRPDLLLPHLRKVLLEPILCPPALVGRSAVLLEDVKAIFIYLVHPTTPSFPQGFRKFSSSATWTSSTCRCPWWWACPGWSPGLFPQSHLSCCHNCISRSSRSNTFLKLPFIIEKYVFLLKFP